LRDAEVEEGPNLYLYAGNNSVNATDLLGLAECCKKEADDLDRADFLEDLCLTYFHYDWSMCKSQRTASRAAFMIWLKCTTKCRPPKCGGNGH
jgi:hypothetical protein